MTEGPPPRKTPRKRTRKSAAPKDVRPESDEMSPEPVEGQDEGASTSSAPSADEGASTSAADIHKESDEKAPIKGAVPEGESEPDAATKPEALTGDAPEGSPQARRQ